MNRTAYDGDAITAGAQLEVRVASDDPGDVANMLRRVATDIEDGGAGGVLEDGPLYAFYDITRTLTGRVPG